MIRIVASVGYFPHYLLSSSISYSVHDLGLTGRIKLLKVRLNQKFCTLKSCKYILTCKGCDCCTFSSYSFFLLLLFP